MKNFLVTYTIKSAKKPKVERVFDYQRALMYSWKIYRSSGADALHRIELNHRLIHDKFELGRIMESFSSTVESGGSVEEAVRDFIKRRTLGEKELLEILEDVKSLFWPEILEHDIPTERKLEELIGTILRRTREYLGLHPGKGAHDRKGNKIEDRYSELCELIDAAAVGAYNARQLLSEYVHKTFRR